MKAVVLSGGQGTRLRPLSWSVPKQLVPIGGRSVLAHVLHDVARSGITEVAIVVSPESQGPVESLLATWDGPSLQMETVVQPEPNGLAAALGVALPVVGDGPVLLYLGDCLITGGIGHVLERHSEGDAAATLLVAKVDDPSRYGIVELGDGDRIARLVEKPPDPTSDLAIVGVYAFRSGIGEVLDRVEPSGRGEYEITDAVQLLVDAGEPVLAAPLAGWWMDTGTIPDALTATARLLDDLMDERSGRLDRTEVSGRVSIAAGAQVEDSHLVGPVLVGPDAVVRGARLGPYTTVGRGAEIDGGSVERSIVMDGAIIGGVSLRDSVVGPRTIVRGSGQRASLSLGADAVVSLDSDNHSG